MKMVKLIEPQGYCMGVKRAIDLVDKILEKDYEKPIYLVGKLIHNDIVMSYYQNLGLIVLDEHNKEQSVENINKGTLVFQAHGTDTKIINKAKEKGLNVIDATCPFVKIIHNRIKKYLDLNYDVIYIGVNKHSESEAVLAISPNIHFVTNLNDINNLNIENDMIYVTNQTTLSQIDINNIFLEILKKYSYAIIDNKICDATSKRQEAVLNSNFDTIIVVGDKKSSNTKRLYELAKEKSEAYLVSNLKELQEINLDKNKNIGITSGASTPSSLVLEIYDYLIK